MSRAWSTRLLRQVRWRSLVGTWRLLGRSGSYRFDPHRALLWTDATSPGRPVRLVMSRAGPVQYNPAARFTPGQLTVRVGEVMALLRELPPRGPRKRVVLLPSQLNAAENDLHFDPRTYRLARYLHDHTGGPRGQLGGDLGLAQFLLDNASHHLDPDRGIDHVRGALSGTRLRNHNGYLVGATAPDGRLRTRNVSVLGALDVPVAGADPDLAHVTVPPATHTVGLMYAAAMPMGAQYDNEGVHAEATARALLTAQYTAAIRAASLSDAPVDLYLMPLGGGVFGNRPDWIARAAASAAAAACRCMEENGMRLHLLAWEGKPQEAHFWRRIAAGH